MNPPAWHVLGAGSIGCLYAARLAAAGLPATLLLRDDAALAAWQAAGPLSVHWPDGSRVQPALPAGVAARADGLALLVCTKAADTVAALAAVLGGGDGEGSLALLLQNGMGAADAVRARWPRLRLWCGVTTAGAWREGRACLHVVATGQADAGPYDTAGDRTPDAAVQALADAGLATLHADVRPLLWRKLAVNACINALTALHGCRNGELVAQPALHARMAELAAEVDRVAQAAGIALGEPALTLAVRVATLTAGNFSSMNRDLAAGRATEVEAINGHVVREGERLGVACPANRAVRDAVLARTPAA